MKPRNFYCNSQRHLLIVAITNRGIFRLLSFISSSTLRIALQESNILGNEKFSTPLNSACSYTFRGDAKKCLFYKLHSCFHDNNGCLCAVWGLIFIPKHCLKSLKCLSHYLTLNKKLLIGTSTIHGDITHIYSDSLTVCVNTLIDYLSQYSLSHFCCRVKQEKMLIWISLQK